MKCRLAACPRVLLLLILLLLTFVLLVSKAMAAPSSIIIIPSEEQTVMILVVDYETEIKLHLQANTGTGYDWRSKSHKIESKIIQMEKQKVVGGTEIHEFLIPRFKPPSEYIFIFKRRWETHSEDQKQFKLVLKPIKK